MTDASPFTQALIGKPVSYIWRGHGSAIILEFGELDSGKNLQDGREAKSTGELSLLIEWSWRIENPHSILGGSFSSEDRWEAMFSKISGARVTDVEFFSHLPEISVSLDNGRRIASFSTVEGQPEWSIISRKPPIGTLLVKRGRLSIELVDS